ncbi:MAG: NHL repeat-containing protein [Anaerolineae bacterium]
MAIYEGFAVEGGNWRNKPGNARVVEFASRQGHSERDKMAVVIDIQSARPVPSILYDRVFAAFTGAYSRSAGSLTRALREAYLSANELILDINHRSDTAHQLLVGLGSAVMRQNEVILAQLGPVMAVYLHQGQVALNPTDSAWLHQALEDRLDGEIEPALGLRKEIEPRFSRVVLELGDILLLCNVAIVRDIPPDALAKALAESHHGALAAIFGPLLTETEAVGLVITVPSGQPVTQKPQKTDTAPVATSCTPEEPPRRGKASAQRVEFQKVHAEQDSPSSGWDKQRRLMGGSVLILTAIAIPLVLMLLVIVARVQYDRLRRLEFNQMRATAQVQYEAALAIGDQTAQRRAMNEALKRTEDGLLALPLDADLLSLRQRILNRLDQLNNVARLYTLTRLLDLGDTQMAAFTSRIIIKGRDLFVLNRGSSYVYHLSLNETGDLLQPLVGDSLIIKPGQQLGGVTLEHIVDIVWVNADIFVTQSRLLALERSGSLVTFDPKVGPNGMALLPVANSDLWFGPQTVGTFEGNLYILDPLQSRILKYVPVESAYTLPPMDYLDPMLGVDLTGVIDMAIDGNIYLLYVDGKVSKFLEGNLQPFSMAGLPSSMKSPLAICVTGDPAPDAPGYVYVADPGSERILQFDKAGNYIRQLMTNPDTNTLRDLQAFLIDEKTGRLFIFSQGAIWLTTLPPLGR